MGKNRTLNMESDRYDVLNKVAEVAAKEKRSLANMTEVLLDEAIEARKLKNELKI